MTSWLACMGHSPICDNVVLCNIAFVLVVLAPFVIGSIPFGLIVGKIYGVDIRQQGSGNIGAANALRAYGRFGGGLVLTLDAAKGFVAAAAVPIAYANLGGSFSWCNVWPYVQYPGFCDIGAAYDLGNLTNLVPLAGLGAVVGHCYSPWLQFKGGKGVATFLGMIFALSWTSALIFVTVWLAIVVPTRFASLGSIVASIVTPVVLWFTIHNFVYSGQREFGTFIAALTALLIVWKHRENITRLREGRENKIGFGRAAT